MKYFSFLILTALTAQAADDAVYGEDNRQDVYLSSPALQNLASTTAAMIDKSNIKNNGSQSVVKGRSLGSMYQLCPNERFRNQPTAANCSGTLIAPNIIMTAAHCYALAKQSCKDYAWVFDYKVRDERDGSVTVSNNDIYECETVLLKEENLIQGLDHALIKLKRPVTGRNFAKMRSAGTIALHTPLILIGTPSGLPTKISDHAFVTTVQHNQFLSNVDAFTINSGSGVFNALTGEVEGILSSGQQDYQSQGDCSTLVKYSERDGKERVVTLERVRSFLQTWH